MKNKKIIVTVILVIIAIILIVITVKNKSVSGNTDLPGGDINNTQENDLTVTLTFPEGYTVTEIAEKLEDNNVCSVDDFLSAVNNPSPEFLEKYSVKKDNKIFVLEGYIFPDTYEFYYNEKAENVVKRFTDNFSSKITQADISRAKELGYSFDEIIRIASIVQEEAGLERENKKVASVIHNRLKSGMQIQCDVTIDYLTKNCEPYLKNGLTEENKQNYNTYKCPALPAGAITNPGYSSIQAALYPDNTGYLFFVTDKDMNYYYSETWDGHVKNCKEAGVY